MVTAFSQEGSCKQLISVVTVVFNGEKEIEGTIQSVLGQSFGNIQYIIVDGGSTDNTLAVIEGYKSRLDYISEKDNGIYDGMNKGMMRARGDWLIFMNAGDKFYNSRVLEEVFSHLDTRGIDIIFGKSITRFRHHTKVRYGDFRLERSNWYLTRMPNHQAVFLSKNLYSVYRFDTSLKYFADTVMLRELFSKYRSKFVDRVISDFELGGASNYYRSFTSFARILKESVAVSGGISKSVCGHVIKFLLQRLLPYQMYMNLYIKYILK